MGGVGWAVRAAGRRRHGLRRAAAAILPGLGDADSEIGGPQEKFGVSQTGVLNSLGGGVAISSS